MEKTTNPNQTKSVAPLSALVAKSPILEKHLQIYSSAPPKIRKFIENMETIIRDDVSTVILTAVKEPISVDLLNKLTRIAAVEVAITSPIFINEIKGTAFDMPDSHTLSIDMWMEENMKKGAFNYFSESERRGTETETLRKMQLVLNIIGVRRITLIVLGKEGQGLESLLRKNFEKDTESKDIFKNEDRFIEALRLVRELDEIPKAKKYLN